MFVKLVFRTKYFDTPYFHSFFFFTEHHSRSSDARAYVLESLQKMSDYFILVVKIDLLTYMFLE